MSLVVFPVNEEDPAVVVSNLSVAAGHERVEEVWAVTAGNPDMTASLESAAAELATAHDTPIAVLPQERVGTLRPGKGDAMNTAIRAAAERGFARAHFYDSDITNFDRGWIDGAESAADRGYGVVRHRFPRAATDAMITWMVTRPGLAMLFPGTILPRVGQPLGGEILLSRKAVELLAADHAVSNRSDWGIDTVLTHATSTMGLPVYEHLVEQGKLHALYGSLGELRTMVLECLDAVAALKGGEAPQPDAVFHADPPAPVPESLKSTEAFDMEASFSLLAGEWSGAEARLAGTLPGDIGKRLASVSDPSDLVFMDEERWGETLRFLIEGFRLGDEAWESLAFRLWLARVLAYATGPVRRGYDGALAYLEATIRRYEGRTDQDVDP